MRVSFPGLPPIPRKAPKGETPPPIPLERPEAKELDKGEYHTYKLRTNPTAGENSMLHSLDIPFFSNGKPEEWLKFEKNLQKVFIGQAVTSGPAKIAIARSLLQGGALASFENSLEGVNETNDTFRRAMHAVKAHVFPKNAAALQRRWLRRNVRKPATMTSREFIARLEEINAYIPLFPMGPEENAHTKLEEEEIVDIVEHGIPRSWQNHWIATGGHNPEERTLAKITELCENMEAVELREGTGPKKEAKTTNSAPGGEQGQPGGKKNKKMGKRKSRDDGAALSKPQGDGKYCMLHGNSGHTTENCRVLQAKAKEMKEAYQKSNKKPRANGPEVNMVETSSNDDDAPLPDHATMVKYFKLAHDLYMKKVMAGDPNPPFDPAALYKKMEVLNIEEDQKNKRKIREPSSSPETSDDEEEE